MTIEGITGAAQKYFETPRKDLDLLVLQKFSSDLITSGRATVGEVKFLLTGTTSYLDPEKADNYETLAQQISDHGPLMRYRPRVVGAFFSWLDKQPFTQLIMVQEPDHSQETMETTMESLEMFVEEWIPFRTNNVVRGTVKENTFTLYLYQYTLLRGDHLQFVDIPDLQSGIIRAKPWTDFYRDRINEARSIEEIIMEIADRLGEPKTLYPTGDALRGTDKALEDAVFPPEQEDLETVAVGIPTLGLLNAPGMLILRYPKSYKEQDPGQVFMTYAPLPVVRKLVERKIFWSN